MAALRLTPGSSSSLIMHTRSGGPSASLGPLRARVQVLESMMDRMMAASQTDLVGIAAGLARTDDRVFIQNMATPTVHHAQASDGGRATCGWKYGGAGRRGDPR